VRWYSGVGAWMWECGMWNVEGETVSVHLRKVESVEVSTRARCDIAMIA